MGNMSPASRTYPVKIVIPFRVGVIIVIPVSFIEQAEEVLKCQWNSVVILLVIFHYECVYHLQRSTRELLCILVPDTFCIIYEGLLIPSVGFENRIRGSGLSIGPRWPIFLLVSQVNISLSRSIIGVHQGRIIIRVLILEPTTDKHIIIQIR